MAKKDHKQAISEINDLWRTYLYCRSVFPALTEDIIGCREFGTAPYYARRGYAVHIRTTKPITSDFVTESQRLGKWINENAVIRLHGIMYYYGFLTKIDQNCPGWKAVDLMRRMRNAWSKTGLDYRPEDQDNLRLKKEVIQHFKLDQKLNEKGEIPVPIDGVVEKIFSSCLEYIDSKFR
jgi:hypothetical protein